MFPDRGGAPWAPHSGDRRTLVDQIGFELSPHAFAEEVVLYPLRPEVGMEERLPRRRRPGRIGAPAVLDKAEQAQRQAADHFARAFFDSNGSAAP
ncbi:hypothetical protein [Streptomyces atacamensis]|uniref:hypothetical protein n=1 Tax=Streptomyces atacamensis TaxID=531966 RepID=UPI00399CBA69